MATNLNSCGLSSSEKISSPIPVTRPFPASRELNFPVPILACPYYVLARALNCVYSTVCTRCAYSTVRYSASTARRLLRLRPSCPWDMPIRGPVDFTNLRKFGEEKRLSITEDKPDNAVLHLSKRMLSQPPREFPRTSPNASGRCIATQAGWRWRTLSDLTNTGRPGHSMLEFPQSTRRMTKSRFIKTTCSPWVGCEYQFWTAILVSRTIPRSDLR